MADRYFVSASGVWGNAANWASSSGGAGGVGIPTSSDDVYLDANSGHCNLTTAGACRSIDCTGYSSTLTHAAGIVLSVGHSTARGDNVAVKFVSAMGYSLGNTSSSSFSFVGTNSTAQTIDWGGETTGNITITSGSWKLASNHTGASIFLNAGTFDTDGYDCAWLAFNSSNTSTRSLLLGDSIITISASSSAWICSISTNMTLTAGTSEIIFTASNPVFGMGALTYYKITARVTTSLTTGNQNSTCTDFHFNGAFGGSILRLGGNLTVTGTLTLGGQARSNQLFVCSDTFNTPRTLTAATVSATNTDFQDIVAAGTGNWDFSANNTIGNCLGNTGITFISGTSCTNTNTNGGTTSWSSLTWTPRIPLPQDNATCTYTINSGSGLNLDILRMGTNVNLSGINSGGSSGLTMNYGAYRFYGNLIMCGPNRAGATGTVDISENSSSSVNFEGRGAHTITSNGHQWLEGTGAGMNINCPGGSYTLQDNLIFSSTSTSVFTHGFGTFDANDYNVSIPFFAGSNTNTRTLSMGNGTWTVFGNNATTCWNLGNVTGLSFFAEGSTLHFNRSTTNACTIQFCYTQYNNFIIQNSLAGTFGNGSVTSTTFNNVTLVGPITWSIPSTTSSGSIYTLTGTLTAKGTSSSYITISSVGGAKAVFTKSSGIGADCDYIKLAGCSGTGGATFFAGYNSINNGLTSGWLFRGVTPRAVSAATYPQPNAYSGLMGWWKADADSVKGGQRLYTPYGASTGNALTVGDIAANTYAAFSFTASRSFNLKKIRAYMSKGGSVTATQTYEIQVRTDSAGSPGTVLGSLAFNGAVVNATNLNTTEFTLSSALALTSGATYWVVFKADQIGTGLGVSIGYSSSGTFSSVRGDATPTWTVVDSSSMGSIDLLADDFGSVGTSEPIHEWKDISGLGRNLTAYSSVRQSSYLGYPAIEVTDRTVQSLYHIGSFSLSTTSTMIAVINTSDAHFLSLSEYGASSPYVGVVESGNSGTPHNGAGDPVYYINGYHISNYIGATRALLYTHVSKGSFLIFSIKFDGFAFVDGLSFFGYLNTYCMTGYIREMMVFNGNLSDINRQKIEAYLGNQYGISTKKEGI